MVDTFSNVYAELLMFSGLLLVSERESEQYGLSSLKQVTREENTEIETLWKLLLLIPWNMK